MTQHDPHSHDPSAHAETLTESPFVGVIGQTGSPVGPSLIALPGQNPAMVQAAHISAVRLDPAGGVVVHTDQGYAFALVPHPDVAALALYYEVVTLWLEAVGVQSGA